MAYGHYYLPIANETITGGLCPLTLFPYVICLLPSPIWPIALQHIKPNQLCAIICEL